MDAVSAIEHAALVAVLGAGGKRKQKRPRGELVPGGLVLGSGPTPRVYFIALTASMPGVPTR